MSKLEMIKDKLNKALLEHNVAMEQVKQSKQALVAASDELDYVEEAQQIIQTMAKTVQENAHQQIASIVSRCLEAVFEQPYRFRIVFEQKRGKTEARLVFLRNGMEVNPLEASGGGVVDVAAFALRLAGVVLTRPKRRRLLVLDEPFKFLSAEYQSRVREMLEVLAREMGFQFVLVTHIPGLVTGKVVRLPQ